MRKLIAFIFVLPLLTACWPTAFLSPRDTSMPEDWRVFFIESLEITTATAPSSYQATLSEALRTSIQNNTRLKLGGNSQQSDLKISGIISNYATSPIAVQQNDNAAKNRLTISINFTILTPTKGLEEIKFTSTRFADYDSNEQLIAVENRLIDEINQQIGQDLINKLLSNW